MRKARCSHKAITFLLVCLLGSLLFAQSALAETKTATHGGPIYLGLDSNELPTTRAFAGPAGIPANAVISKVRVEITGQKNAGDGPSASATYLSVKVNNVAQTFMFSQGVTTTIGKDYTSVAGLSPVFNIQVTGYGMMVKILWGGPYVSTTTTISSLKVIVTYSALYTVTWKNGDAVLETDSNLPYLTIPSYDGAVPSRAADAQYTYHNFIGWDPVPAAVEEDITYQAAYDKTVKEYPVTWKNGDTVLELDLNVPYGSTPEYNGPTPEKEPTGQYLYAFSGWEPAVSAIVGETVYEAVFTPSDRPYTVSFDSAGGSAVTPITQAHGTPVSAPEDPVREGYTFIGWDPAVPDAMPIGGLACTAQWRADPYTITFNSAGGSPVAAVIVDCDAEVVLPPEPARAGYTFDGWTPELPETMPAQNLSCTAMWLRNIYSVRYMPGTQGTFPAATYQLYYNSVIPPIDFGLACNPGYSFVGWSPAVPAKVPAAHTVYTAQWVEGDGLGAEPGSSGYQITFDSAGGSAVKAITVDPGTPLTAPKPPKRRGFAFTGWAPAVPMTMPEYHLTCVAQWEPKVTYYPDNTLCVQGLRLRDIAPELTDNWQMFLPLDLSADGVQIVPLIASNLYYAGEAKVVVKGGSVTVTYTVPGGIEVKSEFLAILPNLAAAVSTDPMSLKDYQFSFGEPVSIRDDLARDTKVVLYIMNVISYNDAVPGIRLFTDRNPDYKTAMEALYAVME